MSKAKLERFRVLSVDDDGTVELLNLAMRKRGVVNPTLWVVTDDDLTPDTVVEGRIEGDPRDSLLFGFPVFRKV